MALTYEAIQTTTLSSPSGSVTFSSIPQTYTDLRVVVVLKETTTYADARMRFNGDSGTATYWGTWIYPFSGTTPSTNVITTANGAWVAQNSNSSGNNQWSMLEIDINNYSNSTNYKTTLSKCSNASLNNQVPAFYNFTWGNTAAITQLEITIPAANQTYVVGSTFTLYGIKAA